MFDAIGAMSREEAATWVAEFIGDKYTESFNKSVFPNGTFSFVVSVPRMKPSNSNASHQRPTSSVHR